MALVRRDRDAATPELANRSAASIATINPVPDNHGGVHHAFAVAHDEYAAALDHLRARGVEITFEEDRQGGVLNGPRAYFHDPDGNCIEIIDLHKGHPNTTET